jgi:hypothetical protein
MTALDYLYFRVHWWNTNVVKDTSFLLLTNVFGVSVFAVLNLTSILILLLVYVWNDGFYLYTKNAQIALITLIAIINYFIFAHKTRYADVVKRFSAYDRQTIKRYDHWLLMYIFLTVMLTIFAITEGRSYFLG